jgi:hypothetical protein
MCLSENHARGNSNRCAALGVEPSDPTPTDRAGLLNRRAGFNRRRMGIEPGSEVRRKSFSAASFKPAAELLPGAPHRASLRFGGLRFGSAFQTTNSLHG